MRQAAGVGEISEKMLKDIQKREKKIPREVADGVPNLAGISGRLKVLVTAAEGGKCGYNEFRGFQEIARVTLDDCIEEMDDIINEIAERFGVEVWW